MLALDENENGISNKDNSSLPSVKDVEISWGASLYIKFNKGNFTGNKYKVSGERLHNGNFWANPNGKITLITLEDEEFIRLATDEERAEIIDELKKYPDDVEF